MSPKPPKAGAPFDQFFRCAGALLARLAEAMARPMEAENGSAKCKAKNWGDLCHFWGKVLEGQMNLVLALHRFDWGKLQQQPRQPSESWI